MKITLKNGSEIYYNEKAFADTEQVAKALNNKTLERDIEAYNKLPNYEGILMSQTCLVGSTLFLEVKVVDSYQASLIKRWMFGKSQYDAGRLHVMGCTLESISSAPLEHVTDIDKDAIKHLYERFVGPINEPQNGE